MSAEQWRMARTGDCVFLRWEDIKQLGDAELVGAEIAGVRGLGLLLYRQSLATRRRAKVLGVEMSESVAGERCSVTMPEGTEAKPGDVVVSKAKRRE